METVIAFPAMVKEYRTANGLTMEQLAEKIGKTKSTISKWESGTRSPKIYEIEEIAHFFGISPQMMMFGEDTSPNPFQNSHTPPQATTSPTIASNDRVVYLDQHLKDQRHTAWISHGESLLEEQEAETNVITLHEDPLYDYHYYNQPASAGTGQYLSDVQVETIQLPVDIDCDFVAPVAGDSMEPDYLDGDYIFVKLSYDLSDGDIGVFDYNGEAYIKQLAITEDGAYLRSLNPEYKDMPITDDVDFRMIGEVVDIYREG